MYFVEFCYICPESARYININIIDAQQKGVLQETDVFIYIVRLLDKCSKIQLFIFVQFVTTRYSLNSYWTDS